jgi:ribonuclease-3
MVEAERVELEKLLGYHFRRPQWLESAVTHSSRRNEPGGGPPVEDNERLELLGDAVLGLVVTGQLLEAFPDWSVGRLNRAKGRLVSAPALHAMAQKLELGRFLQLGPGEEKTGGRQKPNLLADAYEAVVAAIYMDAGLDAAKSFIQRTVWDAAVTGGLELLGQPDPKSALSDRLRELGREQPEYRLLETSGPDHCKMFRVEVSADGGALAAAEGPSKKQAELAAARLALEKLSQAEPLGGNRNV